MRKNRLYILLLASIFWMSCEKYDEVHDEYVKGGEIVYAVKPDNIEVLPGFKRCEIKTELVTTPNLDELVVEWSDEQKTVVIPADTDTAFMTLEMNDMTEGAVLFKLHSTDKNDNKSVVVNAFGNVYGEKYQASLLQRGVKEVISIKEGAKVRFKSSPEKSVGVKLKFEDNAGAINTLDILANTEEVLLEDVKFGSEVKYATMFLPAPNCLDTIPTLNEATIVVPVPELKEKEIALEGSSVLSLDNDTKGAGWGNGNGGLFDGKYTTYGAYESGYPQILTIDLGEVFPLTKLKLWSRLNSDGHYFGKGNPNKIRLFGASELPASNDLADWQLLGAYEFSKPSGGDDLTDADKAFAEAGFECTIENQPEIRYIRVVVDETFEKTSYMYIGDLKFFGMMY
ncbi:hypothetical protein EMN47_02600 [Prolixibacteraceae bacterium JC049]|nr:hypothetical protein [Prolixibacteraceae bacterium JC049]